MLEQIAEDVWSRAIPLRFWKIETGTRMTLMRLPQRRLLVHSPIPLTPELKTAVDALGNVTAILAPSPFHHLSVAAWAAAYPQAITCACPGLERKRHDLRWDRVLGDDAEPEWKDEVDQVFFSARTLENEVVFHHRASRTLVCADMVFNLARHLSPLTRAVAFMLGNRRPGPTLLEHVMIRDRRKAREQIDRMLAWNVERIVLAHGAIVERDGTEILRRAYAWL
jgi:hypothetical protein